VPPTNTNGAGLGLAITERAVRAHGGSVRAHNVAKGGLLVEMTLPLGDRALSPSTPAHYGDGALANRCRSSRHRSLAGTRVGRNHSDLP
jgi:hypothetical protein